MIDLEALKRMSERMVVLHDRLREAGLLPDPEAMARLSRALADFTDRMFPDGLPAPGAFDAAGRSPQLVEQPYSRDHEIENGVIDDSGDAANDQ